MSSSAQKPITNSPVWKKPDEVMQLHRLKRKKRALQERMKQPSQNCPDLAKTFGRQYSESLNFSRLLGGEKRKNPFVKLGDGQDNKKFCDSTENINNVYEDSADNTLFELLALTNTKFEVPSLAKPSDEKLATFTNLFNKISKEQSAVTEEPPSSCGKRAVPIDWSLKTKLRFMSPRPFAWNAKLKASEEASGITGFVRCLDTSKSCTLDSSHHSRFHQRCLYWQHPNLPWINLFPRTSGKVANKSLIAANEEIKEALHKEWAESFRSLFQLLRARQCPYFYVCANTFTCLFQAAGIGGMAETCALLSPTTRGLRQILKQEEIEYSMPLKKNYNKRKSEENTSLEDKDNEGLKNTSFDSCYDTMDNVAEGQNNEKSPPLKKSDEQAKHQNDDGDSGDEDDMESEQWLQSLGVAEDEIKKINYSQLRVNQAAESRIDSGFESLIFVQGVDAQALFNFLLNCKSSIPSTGPFGGIPPTLLAATAFQGGTLQPLKVRESIVQADGGKYYSVELRGPILPTTVHSLCDLLQSNSNSFSGTFANLQQTVPFSRATKILAEGEKREGNTSNIMPSIFGKENLSDCGLNEELLERFCSSDTSLMETIDSLAYSEEKKVYTWS